MTRRSRTSRATVALTAIACVTLAGFVGSPVETDAAWTDGENAQGVMAAGRVERVTNFSCTPRLLGPIDFEWTTPVGGLTRSSYRWTVTGVATGSGTLLASATGMTITPGLLLVGSGVYSLYAVGPGGWETLAARANVTFITGLLGSCTPQTLPPL